MSNWTMDGVKCPLWEITLVVVFIIFRGVFAPDVVALRGFAM